ncbi:hypothetical protein DID78_03980 [Candidatus Marinamargulisbacteria bacterium SCGC AG-343-D04]|nr:hypothetical protein DID78_03980 [Candidatus Marinamargulisbacteria bacterium SCGC AG-343-D04]
MTSFPSLNNCKVKERPTSAKSIDRKAIKKSSIGSQKPPKTPPPSRSEVIHNIAAATGETILNFPLQSYIIRQQTQAPLSSRQFRSLAGFTGTYLASMGMVSGISEVVKPIVGHKVLADFTGVALSLSLICPLENLAKRSFMSNTRPLQLIKPSSWHAGFAAQLGRESLFYGAYLTAPSFINPEDPLEKRLTTEMTIGATFGWISYPFDLLKTRAVQEQFTNSTAIPKLSLKECIHHLGTRAAFARGFMIGGGCGLFQLCKQGSQWIENQFLS